jgi:hypothetical protein
LAEWSFAAIQRLSRRWALIAAIMSCHANHYVFSTSPSIGPNICSNLRLILPFPSKVVELSPPFQGSLFSVLNGFEPYKKKVSRWRCWIVAKSIAEWMSEGEALYASSLKEYEELNAKLQELETVLMQKQEEVNQIAQIIGKPLVEGNRRLTAQLIDEHGPKSVPNSPSTIARALTGRNLNR